MVTERISCLIAVMLGLIPESQRHPSVPLPILIVVVVVAGAVAVTVAVAVAVAVALAVPVAVTCALQGFTIIWYF